MARFGRLLLGVGLAAGWAAGQPAGAAIKLTVPAGYLPGLPALVRVEALTPEGARRRELWDAEATLSASGGITLSTNRVLLRNGLGTALVRLSGSGDFLLTATLGAESTNRLLADLSGVPVTLTGGTLAGTSTTWRGVVRVTNTVTVPAGHTLTIESNTWVLLDGAASGTTGPRLVVNGSVQSLGTELEPVTITCSDPALRWGQIRHENAQPSLYRHTSIHRGGRAPGEGHTGQAPVLRPSNSTLVFESCNLTDFAETVRGAPGYGTPGKVMQASGSDLTFRDCVLARARMGPEIAGTALLLTNSWITDMLGPDDADGLYIHAQSGGQSCALRDAVVAVGDDDGLDTLDSTVWVERCIIRDWHNLLEDAKGISVFNGATHLRRSLLVDNTVGLAAKWSSGPATLVTIQHCTLTANDTNVIAAWKANAPGPFIDIRLTNSILWAGRAAHSDFGPTNFTIVWCDLAEPWPGEGNFTADPLFVDAAGHDFHLLPGSPCINAGDPAAPLDPDGSRADLGAFPFEARPNLLVSLTAPTNGAVFPGPTNVLLAASATAATGSVARVEFLEAGRSLGEGVWSEEPGAWSLLWSNVPVGFHRVQALATDHGGQQATSAPVCFALHAGFGPMTNTLIARGSEWKYLDDGSDQGTAWTLPAFDASSWSNGLAQLGYGDGDEVTLIRSNRADATRIITTYFRRALVVEEPERVQGLLLDLLRDDGAAVYLNGEEVFRVSLPEGPLSYQTLATTATEYDWLYTNVPAGALVAGTNLLAAEVHQASLTSSDVSFDLALHAVLGPPPHLPPLVQLSCPAGDLTVAAPADLALEALAADPDGVVTQVVFLANGVPAGDGVWRSEQAAWSLLWSNLPAGAYALAAVALDNLGLSATSGVVLLSVSTNTAPPVVLGQTPPPGELTNLTQITVRFSKPVRGVDAADLLINGLPASGLSGTGSNYTFTFPQPAYGPVTVSWAADHGITDLFTPPHPFDAQGPGATWQYQLHDAAPPLIRAVEPPPGATVAALTAISVTFTEPVNGLDAGDLRVNGAAAEAVSGAGAGPYLFSFAQPPAGPVAVAWADGADIRDLSGNLFQGGPWSYQLDPAAAGVVIHEIMYHPASDDPREEYVELFNRGAAAVDLSGWRLTGGLRFTFPTNTLLPAGGYLVVAAHRASFTHRYPGVTNVIGDWIGFEEVAWAFPTFTNVVRTWTNVLSNRRNTLELEDAAGARVDRVRYADEGDWAVRMRGQPSPFPTSPYRGWVWFKEHDGLGKSLELINPALPNEHGQNWAASLPMGGTPGRPNSVSQPNLAPLILEVRHFPPVPRSSESVSVSARIVDESGLNVTVTLHHRADAVTPPPFEATPMLDDGQHGDGVAGDGIFGAVLPPQPHATVVEFYLEATDAQGHTRTWPAPCLETNGVVLGQQANALYQVDDNPASADQPFYRLILREVERRELYAIGHASDGTQRSDAQMNGTFISTDGTGTDCRYRVGIRNRGHGTRNRQPNNFRVNFPSDEPWKGVSALNLNGQYTHAQILGAAVAQRAGVAGADSRAVQVRVNSTNLALLDNFTRTYGAYAANEVVGGDWAEHHFPDDGEGNAYRVIRDIAPPDLVWRGPNAHAYTNTYFKLTNARDDDWTDLITLHRLFGTNDLFTAANLRRILDLEQWVTHLAVMAIFANAETGLNSGYNDDYQLYRGIRDPRFRLVYYDLDTVLGEGGSGPTNATIFGCTANNGSGAAFSRFLNYNDGTENFRQLYFRTLARLLDTAFSAPAYNALVDQVLGGYLPANVTSRMKSWMDGRRAYIRSILATNLVPLTNLPLATLAGEPRSPTPLTSATLSVGGAGVTHYRFKLNDGPFGPETPVATPIVLTGLADGSLNTVTVLGRDAAGRWQSAAAPTVSKSWLVRTDWPGVRLNEVLARNDAAYNHYGTWPDWIELFNEGAAPVDLSGLRLTDELANSNRFTFPPGTVLAPGAYLVVLADNPNGTPGLHTGFALEQNGEGVFLLDRAERGGALLDAVVFGRQLADRALGRLGGGEFVLTQPTPGAANVAQALGEWRGVKINEWLAAGQGLFTEDFVELFNPAPLPVALGGLHLSDAPQGTPGRHALAPLSFIEAGGFAVFVADGQSERGSNHLNFQLASEQGQIALTAPDLEVLDHVWYGPQRLGVAQGRCPDGGLGIVALATPTPGSYNACPVPPPSPQTVTLLAATNLWRYDTAGLDRGTAWRERDYDDADWAAGPGNFHAPPARAYTVPQPVLTLLPAPSGRPTYYFRTTFTVPADAAFTSLQFTHAVDDGAVFYLNGVEVGRFNLPSGDIGYNTLATGVGDASWVGPVPVALTNLAAGTNVFAAELHQNSPTSADAFFGLILEGLVVTNSPALAGVVINEVLANNASVRQPDGSTPDWVELYNPSSNTVDLAGMSLSDRPDNPRRWVFPDGSLVPPLGFLTVGCDADQPASAINTGFGLKTSGDALYLFNRPADGSGLRDFILFGLQTPDLSVGRVPDGSSNWVLCFTTPAASNTPAPLGSPTDLKVNEWLANPPPGEDDWFELYNPGALPVALGGLYLTDVLNEPTKYPPIPALSFIGAGSNAFQKFVADGNTAAGADHVAFALRAAGEALGIADTNGLLLDGYAFPAQTEGVSQGRLPDGAARVEFFPGSASPGEMNYLPLAGVVINEVLSHSDPPFEDAIEVLNLSAAPVDLTGWWLSDARSIPCKFRIPPGPPLASGGLRVFYEYQFNTPETAAIPFALSSSQGDQVYLWAAGADGRLNGYRASAAFGAAESGVSWGRWPTSVGVDFVPLSRRTFGMDAPATVEEFRLGEGLPNAEPKVGPLVITEIMYHPAETNEALEFIELRNLTATNLPLGLGTNGWRLREGVDFEFAPDTLVPAGGCVVVVGFDPRNDPAALALFQAAYGTNATLCGPWNGRLDNGGETIELAKPDEPPPDGKTPYVLVDRVAYDDVWPWPPEADGTGWSLQRIADSAYGNEPANWTAAPPSPGACEPTAPTNAPPALDPIGDKLVPVGTLLSFAVTARDPDQPAQSLRFSLDPGTPPGASITPDGWFTWTPDPAYAGTTNFVTVRVTDDGAPPLSAFETIGIVVVGPARLAAATVSPEGTLTLQWASQPGARYRVEFTDDLAAPHWTPLGADLEAEAWQTTVTDVVQPNAQRFYRVVLLP